MIYKTAFTDKRLIEVRKSNSIRRQPCEETVSHFSASEVDDWHETLKETIAIAHGEDD